MSKIIIAILLVFQLFYGAKYMWFHQDDLAWIKGARHSWTSQLTTPVNEHINYVFRIMFKAEYELFGWNYSYYLIVSLLLHAGVIFFLIKIVKKLTGSEEWGAIAGVLFAINTNWNEVVLWVSGQTIAITVLLVMWVIWLWLNDAKTFVLGIAMWLASMTSALAAWLPVALLIFSRNARKITYLSLLVLGWMLLIYYLASQGVTAEIGHKVQVIVGVVGLGIVNSVIGRLWWPFEIGERLRIATTLLVIAINSSLLRKVMKDRRVRFLTIGLAGYYMVVAIGRAQYGIGMMRAERYAYLGLALFLPILIMMLKELKLKMTWVGVGMIVVMQIGGFVARANHYVVRPQQLKAWVSALKQKDKTICYQDDFYPEYIFGNANIKYSEYSEVFDDWSIGGEECNKM